MTGNCGNFCALLRQNMNMFDESARRDRIAHRPTPALIMTCVINVDQQSHITDNTNRRAQIHLDADKVLNVKCRSGGPR
jgi:hypothetical protein